MGVGHDATSYRVIQTREVIVVANNPTDAALLADVAFQFGQNEDNSLIETPDGVWGNTLNRVRITDLSIGEA